MKKWLAIGALFMCFNSKAQDSTKPLPINYKTYTTFPAFPLLALDSSKFNSSSVSSKKEPVVIIYFSPTCGHCQHQAEEITSHINDFKGVQFLFVSSYSMQEIRQFSGTYGLAHFANITVASDPSFSMGQFFELKSLPGIFVYNRKGKFKTHFDTNILAENLAAALSE